MDALAFLSKSGKSKRQAVYALIGDEEFLKRRVRDALITRTLGDADPTLAVSTYAGENLDFSTARNDLDTLPFLSPCRIVVIENADQFITENRPALEKYVAQPSAVGILILDAKAFPETTKLAKALPEAAKIICKAPYANKLPAWCIDWAQSEHSKTLSRDAAQLLVEQVGTAMGLLDQELAKLAVAVGEKPAIDAALVERLVSRSRSADVFRIMDAVGDGQPAKALAILEELFAEGEDPMAVMGPLTWQLRQLASVGRFHAGGLSLDSAMAAANVPRFRTEGYAKQARRLGLRRLNMLTQWLIELNHGMKGGSALPPRVQLEQLIVRLARPRS